MVWLCRISIYAWMPDSWEIIWNKFDFILFFFSALNFPLAVESGSRTIKNSRNPDELDTGCATVAQLRLPSPLKDSPCSGKWRATLCSACTLHRYEYICWYKICKGQLHLWVKIVILCIFRPSLPNHCSGDQFPPRHSIHLKIMANGKNFIFMHDNPSLDTTSSIIYFVHSINEINSWPH